MVAKSLPPDLAKKTGRELQALSRSITTGVGKKYSPERLQAILTSMALYPVITTAAQTAGCSTSSIKYWLAKSENGDPGFMVTWNDEEKPFHEHWAEAQSLGDGRVEQAAFEFALGYDELSVYKGRIVYQIDPMAEALGLLGIEAYLKDEHGRPVPEKIHKQDPEMVRWLLERRQREKYGKHDTVDVNHTGGILVVGVKKTVAELEQAYGGSRPVQDVEFVVEEEAVETDDDDPTA